MSVDPKPAVAVFINRPSPGERALAALSDTLGSLDSAAVVRPSADPRACAMTCLLIADFIVHNSKPGGDAPESQRANAPLPNEARASGDALRAKPDGAITPEPTGAIAIADHLQQVARALMHVIGTLGGEYLSETHHAPEELISRGEVLRATMTTALEKCADSEPDIQPWIEASRLNQGAVGLVYSLRTLCDATRHLGDGKTTANGGPAEIQAALAAADAIEFALRSEDSSEQSRARNTAARLWTLLVAAHEKAITCGAAHRAAFALVPSAAHRRARRRSASLVPSVEPSKSDVFQSSRAPALDSPRAPDSAPSRPTKSEASSIAGVSTNTHAVGPASGQARGSVKVPASPALPAFDALELYEAGAGPDTVRFIELHSAPKPSTLSATDSSGAGAGLEIAPPSAVSAGPRPSGPPSTPVSSSPSTVRRWGPDSRSESRHLIELEARITNAERTHVGFTENLSIHGVFIATFVGFSIGTSVEVCLCLSDDTELTARGLVRWTRSAGLDSWPGIGIQFEALQPEAVNAIRNLLSAQNSLRGAS